MTGGKEMSEVGMSVVDLEFVQDALSEEKEAFASLCSPWDDVIMALHEQIRNLASMREADLAVMAKRKRLAELEQRVANLKYKIKEAKK